MCCIYLCTDQHCCLERYPNFSYHLCPFASENCKYLHTTFNGIYTEYLWHSLEFSFVSPGQMLMLAPKSIYPLVTVWLHCTETRMSILTLIPPCRCTCHTDSAAMFCSWVEPDENSETLVPHQIHCQCDWPQTVCGFHKTRLYAYGL